MSVGKKELNCEMLSAPYRTLSQSLVIRDDVVKWGGEKSRNKSQVSVISCS